MAEEKADRASVAELKERVRQLEEEREAETQAGGSPRDDPFNHQHQHQGGGGGSHAQPRGLPFSTPSRTQHGRLLVVPPKQNTTFRTGCGSFRTRYGSSQTGLEQCFV